MATLDDIVKASAETRDVAIDMSPWCPGATVASTSVAASLGDVVATLESGGTTLTPIVRLSGGTPGTHTAVTVTSALAGGQIVPRSFKVLVREFL